jgi:protocatechuate 3,4-dioxygenase alpha subunit
VRTPSQTVGPYFAIGLPWEDGPNACAKGIALWGHVLDGAGDPVPDAILETWQADPPADEDFRGFTRVPTDDDGRWEIRIRRPDGDEPFVALTVFGRGMLRHVRTRVYFEAADVPEAVPEERRGTLVAKPDGDQRWQFDIRLQGESETVFLAP